MCVSSHTLWHVLSFVKVRGRLRTPCLNDVLPRADDVHHPHPFNLRPSHTHAHPTLCWSGPLSSRCTTSPRHSAYFRMSGTWASLPSVVSDLVEDWYDYDAFWFAAAMTTVSIVGYALTVPACAIHQRHVLDFCMFVILNLLTFTRTFPRTFRNFAYHYSCGRLPLIT